MANSNIEILKENTQNVFTSVSKSFVPMIDRFVGQADQDAHYDTP